MKKIICLLLCLLTLATLAACEEKKPENSGFAAFSQNGVEVSLDAEAEPIISALGAYLATAETDSCYGDGKDKVYEYTSFKIQTYSSNGKDYVLSVEIYNDSDASVATPEGARVGDSAESVLAKYGEANVRTDTQIVYFNYDNDTKLQFLLRDGNVTNIQYLKAE